MSYLQQNVPGDIRHFYKNPVTGEFEPIQVIKDVDLAIGKPVRYDEPRSNYDGIKVHVEGLETYEQVKDLIGYVHGLWEKK